MDSALLSPSYIAAEKIQRYKLRREGQNTSDARRAGGAQRNPPSVPGGARAGSAALHLPYALALLMARC
jgi:hypothetical protein